MRKLILCGALLGGMAIAFSSQSCKGEAEPINGVCRSFCDELVNAMDDSDYYDLSFEGVGGTKTSCGKDCTEVVNEYKKLDRGSMSDCVECIADKGFNQIGGGSTDLVDKDDWTMGVIPMDIVGPDGDDCTGKCDRDDIKYTDEDGMLMADFLTDFATDFVHHWSNAEPFCDSYNGDDLCCKESNPCFIVSHNGDCECSGDCGWDYFDCEGGTDIDTDVDSDTDADTDSDTDTDTELTYCTGYTGTSTCCTEENTCDYAEDGTCDCDGTCSWDAVDCA